MSTADTATAARTTITTTMTTTITRLSDYDYGLCEYCNYYEYCDDYDYDYSATTTTTRTRRIRTTRKN